MATSKKGKSLELQLIDFKKDCINNQASEVIQEAMDEAIRSTITRLKRIGQTFPAVEEEGADALAAIIDMRVEIADWPICGESKAAAEARKQEDPALSQIRAKMAAGGVPTIEEAQIYLDWKDREKAKLKKRKNLPY